MTLSYIPADTNAEGILKAAASGVLPNGKPVIVNADGTVSVVGPVSISQVIGTPVVYESAIAVDQSAVYDSNAQKVVVAYKDSSNSSYGTVAVGTVSGSSISFGTPVTFGSGGAQDISTVYDANAQKVVIFYHDDNNSSQGTAIVGTVSGTSISFGTAVLFYSGVAGTIKTAYDSNAQKIVVAYRDHDNGSYGRAKVGTVSGTSISFGSHTEFTPSAVSQIALGYDSSAQKIVLVYRGTGVAGSAIVGTVSGTSISFGSATSFAPDGLGYPSVVYDSNAQKVVIPYVEDSRGKAIVGTVSGTSISFGTAVIFSTGNVSYLVGTYHSDAKKVVMAYTDADNSNYGTVIVGTVSGTSISYSSSAVFEAAYAAYSSPVYDSNANKVVIPYSDIGASYNFYGTAVVFQPAYTSLNLTAENYIGMSSGVVDVESGTQAIGSPAVFESATSASSSSTFDSSSNKVVVAYRDGGNSQHGTAVVGTVSGTSISFGSPVVFNSSGSYAFSTTFDSNSNKVVIAYQDAGNSFYGTAIVGTVSGTAISFGSPVVFNTASSTYNAATFDSSSNKVVIAYSSGTVSGDARVGTISGTAISFGTAVEFNSSRVVDVSATFDSSSNKVVISYNDYSNSQRGTARVGTVSDTAISFGTAVIFEANASYISSVFDPSSNKVVISYNFYNGSADVGTAIVGTVSGTSISFGTSVTFNASSSAYTSATFDSNASRVIIAYYDGGNSNYGTVIVGTVSGTAISFGSEAVFENATSTYISSAFDSNSNKVIIAYTDGGNSSYGTAIVFQPGYTNITRGEVPSGSQAITNIIGSVSSIQTGLTAGQSYFVQTDGTIGLTADDPSVFAGTAISATKLIVKT